MVLKAQPTSSFTVPTIIVQDNKMSNTDWNIMECNESFTTKVHKSIVLYKIKHIYAKD